MVEWESANVDDLQRAWQSELDAMNQHTVKALDQTAVESRALMPLLATSSKALAMLRSQYAAYCEQLDALGRTMQSIQEINEALHIQSTNQQAIIDAIQGLGLEEDGDGEAALVSLLDKPQRAMEVAEGMRRSAEKLSPQDPQLAAMLAVREKRRKTEQSCALLASTVSNYLCNVFSTFAQPSTRTLGLTDQQTTFLRVYQPVIGALQVLDAKRHLECYATLQIHLNTHFAQSLKGLLGRLDSRHLIQVEQSGLVFSRLSQRSMAAGIGASILSTFDMDPSLEADGPAPTKAVRANVDYSPHPLHPPPSSPPELKPTDRLDAGQAVHYMLLHIACWMQELQSVLGLDAKAIHAITLSMNDQVAEVWAGNGVTCFHALTAVEQRLQEKGQLPDALRPRLEQLKQQLTRHCDAFISSQIQAIREQRLSAKRRNTSVLPFVGVLPAFIEYFDGNDSEAVRTMIRTIATACIKHLDTLQRAAPEDDKEQVNAAVMIIINSSFLTHRLPEGGEAQQLARQCLDRALTKYMDLNGPRVFGDRLYGFLQGLQGECRRSASVQFKEEYSKSNARKVLLSPSNPSTIKDGVAYVKDRIQRHFQHDPALWDAVLRAWHQDTCSRVASWKSAVRTVYPDIAVPCLDAALV